MDMNVQSKMNAMVNPHTFIRDKVNLKSYKVYELKNIAKKYKLHVSGTKTVLINRIKECFERIQNVVLIQSLFRRKMIIHMIELKGPALKNRKICTNDTDFYTLEPLEDIKYYDFFSYCDNEGFIYGFDINSLILLLKKKSVINNPYNRKVITFDIVRKVSALSKLNRYIHDIYDEPRSRELTVREQTIERMNSVRSKSILDRVQNLFYEIDLLGNYTSTEWFHELSEDDCVSYLRQLWDIWNIRSNMPMLTRKRVCPYFNPFFEGVHNLHIRNGSVRDIEVLKNTCLTIMENLIYTGINEHYKQIGATIVLTALTAVSTGAREGFPWLYESLL
jgi:hypothetical protein